MNDNRVDPSDLNNSAFYGSNDKAMTRLLYDDSRVFDLANQNLVTDLKDWFRSFLKK
jgi:hypothetical protein